MGESRLNCNGFLFVSRIASILFQLWLVVYTYKHESEPLFFFQILRAHKVTVHDCRLFSLRLLDCGFALRFVIQKKSLKWKICFPLTWIIECIDYLFSLERCTERFYSRWVSVLRTSILRMTLKFSSSFLLSLFDFDVLIALLRRVKAERVVGRLVKEDIQT